MKKNSVDFFCWKSDHDKNITAPTYPSKIESALDEIEKYELTILHQNKFWKMKYKFKLLAAVVLEATLQLRAQHFLASGDSFNLDPLSLFLALSLSLSFNLSFPLSQTHSLFEGGIDRFIICPRQLYKKGMEEI